MKYEEIISLLDKGFTPEYIMKMGQDVDNNTDEVNNEDPEPAPDPEPASPDMGKQFAAYMEKMETKFDQMIKEMQAANIMASKQKVDESSSDDPAADALASIIMPKNHAK